MEEINKLLEMLKINPSFQSFPAEKREVFARLADAFYENDFALHLNPSELTAKLRVGNKQMWYEFLNMEPVRQYINAQMAFNAQIASRKAFQTLVTEGLQGDTHAIKQVNEISGVLNTGDRNKVIVMHQISRPQVVRQSE
jgi:hypothetical protein